MTTDQETIDVLRRARVRLAVPGQWCRGADARDASGCDVAVDSEFACRWCVYGAVNAEGGGAVALAALREEAPGGLLLSTFNDEQTSGVEPVLEMFDRAIAKLEAQS